MANDNLATRPQFWALRGLMILFQEIPIIGLVNRQFAPALAQAGDTVNAYRAAKRRTRRKTETGENTELDVTTVAVPVVLDQYFFDSFVLFDRDDALSITELDRLHATPAIQTIATGVSRALCGRVHAFLRQGTPAKRAGRLDTISKDNAADFILEAEQVLSDNKAPMNGVYVAVVHHTANAKLMRSTTFERMDARGSDGTVMTGRVGKVYNTTIVMSQDVNYVDTSLADTENKAVNNAAGYNAGDTVLTTDGGGTNYSLGEYVVVAANDQPTFATAATATTSVTLNEPLKFAVVDDAVIKHYQKCTNEATLRAAGYQEEMVFTHAAAKNLQEGQLISFGTGGSRHTYTVIEIGATASTTTEVLLDRPLEASVASGETECFPGPGGSMNPVLHRDALALVTRPMKAKNGKGVVSAVVNFEGIGLRVQEGDDLKAGGTRYVFDLLAGVSVLDEDLLVVMLG